MLPRISVVIPAYNEERYLPFCLEALLNQTYPKDKYEVIVVDNNSTDETAETARSYGARVLMEKRQGHVFALNKGMKAAKYEIIAVTDADTEVNNKWLATIEKAFRDKEVVALTGGAHYGSRSKIINFLGKMMIQTYFRLHFALGRTALTGFNLAVRKNAFYRIRGLDIRYQTFSDVDLGLRMKKVGKVIYCKELSVITSPRRWQKGSFEDYYKYTSGYFKSVWLQKPCAYDLTPRR